MGELVPDVYVRFGDLKGECTDEQHPGNDGWIEIKHFTFGFGMKEGSWDSGSSSSDGGGTGSSSAGSGASSLPLEFPAVSITKSSDLTSTRLLKEKCHEGKAIEKVELIACRYGGNDGNKPKIPFLRMIFKNVHIGSISLGLSQDELPSETLTFTYDMVQMETIWTDNETGDRLTSDPNRCGWNKEKNKEDYIES